MRPETRMMNEVDNFLTGSPLSTWRRVPKLGWAMAGVRDGFYNSPKSPPTNEKYEEQYESGYSLGKKCR